MNAVNWVIVAGIAAVVGALGGWIPLFLARRNDRDTLVKTAQIVDKLPGMVAKVDKAAERLTVLETRLDEREKREGRDQQAAERAAELAHREYCEDRCPVRKDWEMDNISAVRPNPLKPSPVTEGG